MAAPTPPRSPQDRADGGAAWRGHLDTGDPAPDDAGVPRPRRARPPAVRSARFRIVGWLVGLVAVALGVSVALSWAVQVQRMDERIDRSIVTELGEFRTLAEAGTDPLTAEPFTDVRRLLRVAVERNVDDRNETMFAVVNGTPFVRSAQPPPERLDDQPGLVALVAASSAPLLGTLETERGTVRYGAAPVEVPGSQDRGVLVVGVFRDLERAEIDELTRTAAAVGFGTLALAALAAWVLAGRVLRPVRQVRDAARDISETDLSRRIPVSGDHEVADLARTFNDMLDRLQTSFATQKQFVSDAGHELRTPITIVQGHVELLDADPESREESKALVLDELDRMRRMVDDLLVLTRTEQPDFLRRGEVDLAPFTDELVDKARALAPRRWALEHLAEGTAVMDRHRVTQAVVQLAANAVQHTAEEDRISLGTRVVGDEVHLWVRDSGPGIPREDRERVFERFARASNTRGRTSGTGLGLAIVQAIARSHGGRVVLLEPSAGGAELRLELPLQQPSPDGGGAA